MNIGNFAVELGEHRVEQERQFKVRQAQNQLKCEGQEDCDDCGKTIPAARRKAAPFTARCIGCQTRHEDLRGRAA